MTPAAPLGPIKWNPVFRWQRGYQADDEGYEMIAETWLDQMGHEYTSIEHVALCAVAKALGVSR
jgi:hypothetical protein